MQVLDIIRHSKDDAAELPRRALTKLLYGSNSVFARTATAEQASPCSGPLRAAQVLSSGRTAVQELRCKPLATP